MTTRASRRLELAACLSLILAVQAVAPAPVAAQPWKRITQAAVCAGGAFGGVKLGEKIADFEAKRLKLAPEQAKKHRRAFQIGLALALCGGGAAIAGTAYDGLSKRGKQAREKEVMAALEDAQPHTYADPENPQLQGTVIAQPAQIEGEQECRVVEDQLGGDQALVKYCRSGPNGKWAVKAS
jgi:hypothetical protein